MIKKNWQTFGLILLLTFHLVSNIIWQGLNSVPPSFDPSNHTIIALEIKDCLVNLPQNGLLKCLRITPFYPPFIHTIVALVLIVFGSSIKLAQLMNTLFFMLAIIGVFLWVKEFFKNKTVALLTAVFISFLPEFYNLSRSLWQEVLVLAITYFTMYFLLKSEGFTKGKHTALSFVLLGLGIITKWNIVIYLVIPFIFTFYKAIKAKGFKEALRVSIFGIVISIIILAPWLLANITPFLFFSKFWSTAEPKEPTQLFSLQNLSFYITWFIRFTFGLIPTVFLAVVIAPLLRSYSKAQRVYIITYGLFTYGFFTFLGNKDPRYLLELIPFSAVLMIEGIHKFFFNKNLKAGYTLVGVIIFFFLMQYLKFSFDFPTALKFRSVWNLPLLGYTDFINLSSNFYPAQPYDNKSNWQNEKILEDVNTISNGAGAKLLTLAEYPALNNRTLLLEAKVNGYNNILVNEDYPFGHENGFDSQNEVINFIKSKNFVLVPEHEPANDTYKFKTLNYQIQRVFYETDTSGFAQVVESYELPYESLNEYIMSNRDPENKGLRYDICEKTKCNHVYLYKINRVNQINLPTSGGYIKTGFLNSAPQNCTDTMCNLVITLAPYGWARVTGSPMEYGEEIWKYTPLQGQGTVWVFANNTDKQITTTIRAWAKGNAINTFTAAEQTKLFENIYDDMKTGVSELRNPGNCTENGCTTIGYIVWNCNDTKCEVQNKYDPVNNSTSTLIPNHEELFGVKTSIESSTSKK